MVVVVFRSSVAIVEFSCLETVLAVFCPDTRSGPFGRVVVIPEHYRRVPFMEGT